MNYINKATYHDKVPDEVRGESSDQPSMTVPDEANTIQELMARHRTGQKVEENEPVYLDVEDVKEIDKYFKPGALDLTDLDQLNKKAEMLKSKARKALEKKKQQELEEQRKEEYRKQLQEEQETEEEPEPDKPE